MNFQSYVAFREKLESNLKSHSARTNENTERLRRKVAFDRLLARIYTQDASPFFLKGGYAMELRVSHARATKDMDLTRIKTNKNASEPMSKIIFQDLQILARINLNDHFSFRISPPKIDIENAPYGGSRHNVVAVIDNNPFVTFDLDVGGDFVIGHVEKISGVDWLGFCGIAAPTISMISIEQQFAEKLHSYTLPREQINTRAKDLIDMILLLKLSQRSIADFINPVSRVFKARNTHSLPVVLPEPPQSWQRPFSVMALECGIKDNLKEGFKYVSKFYDEFLRINQACISETPTNASFG